MIYCVEDDASIRELTVYALNASGFSALGLECAEALWQQLGKEQPELILLDIMLPDEDGISILKKLRAAPATAEIPVILATAKGTEFDKVIGLEIGADDYVTKPFSNRELQARVKALLRRSEFAADPQLENDADTEIVIGDLHILPDAFLVQKGNKELDLTHREFELLYHLATHVGQVMTREHLLETVWGYDYFGDVRTVDVTVRRLREKIEDTPGRPEYILTRRGVGYYMRNND